MAGRQTPSTPDVPTDPKQRLLILVRGGADPLDATLSLGASKDDLATWLEDGGFGEELERAEAHARMQVDSGRRRQRPGEMERRRPESTRRLAERLTREVSLPGKPMRCTAKVWQRDEDGNRMFDVPPRPCKNWAMKGQTVCDSHGGKAPQNLAWAQKRLALRDRKLGDVYERFAHAAEGTALDVFEDELARTNVLVEVLWAATLEEDVSLLGLSDTSVALGVERDRRVKVAEVAARLGIDERQARATEQVARSLSAVVVALIDHEALGLTGDQRAVARRLFRELASGAQLKALPGGAG